MANVTTADVANVTLQQLSDAGLNPFAVQLLVESFARGPLPVPIEFTWRGVVVSLRAYESDREGRRDAMLWSREHGGWWKPGAAGYTEDVRHAGWFTTQFAQDAARRAPGIEIPVFGAEVEAALRAITYPKDCSAYTERTQNDSAGVHGVGGVEPSSAENRNENNGL